MFAVFLKKKKTEAIVLVNAFAIVLHSGQMNIRSHIFRLDIIFLVIF